MTVARAINATQIDQSGRPGLTARSARSRNGAYRQGVVNVSSPRPETPAAYSGDTQIRTPDRRLRARFPLLADDVSWLGLSCRRCLAARRQTGEVALEPGQVEIDTLACSAYAARSLIVLLAEGAQTERGLSLLARSSPWWAQGQAAKGWGRSNSWSLPAEVGLRVWPAMPSGGVQWAAPGGLPWPPGGGGWLVSWCCPVVPG